jgi:hypothetical protein
MELLQPLCLMALMSVLPALLGWVGQLEGIIANSWNQMVVLSRYYCCAYCYLLVLHVYSTLLLIAVLRLVLLRLLPFGGFSVHVQAQILYHCCLCGPIALLPVPLPQLM